MVMNKTKYFPQLEASLISDKAVKLVHDFFFLQKEKNGWFESIVTFTSISLCWHDKLSSINYCAVLSFFTAVPNWCILCAVYNFVGLQKKQKVKKLASLATNYVEFDDVILDWQL